MTAIIGCLQSKGISVQENSLTADAAIIWSMLWSGRMQANQHVYNVYRAQQKPVIVVEVGALNRGVTWKISVNHVTAQGYYGHHDNLDLDRPKKLGINLFNKKDGNPAVLVAAQHNRSHQLSELVSQERWISESIALVRQHTDRPVHVRPHPRSTLNTKMIPNDVIFVSPIKIPNTYDSFDIQFDYHAVINYNSGPGIQAAIFGTRPIVDCSSLAYSVSVSPQDIEKSYNVPRDQWLIEIAHTEYLIEEIERGVWIPRLAPRLPL